MNYFAIFFIICLSILPPISYGAEEVFKISAGSKILELKNAHTEWVDFCINKKMGCARFKITKENDVFNYGFIKIMSDKILQKEFQKYCRDTFYEIKTTDKNANDYLEELNKNLSSCLWTSDHDTTLIYWKDGLTILVITAKKSLQDAIVIIDKAKIYEKN
jgi:hypothetical protein